MSTLRIGVRGREQHDTEVWDSASFRMGRAIGETMAVIMVAGNALKIPTSILDPLRTLTSNIALELAYASGDHRLGLFSTGVVLLVIIMTLNYIANFAIKRRVLK